MNISKYILFIGLILLPALSYAQRIGSKYIVTTGDTTQIVNSVSGLKSPDAKFLLKKNTAAGDSVLANMSSDYSSLEEALMDVNSLITSVEKDQAHLKTGNTGLSYRLSKMNIEGMQKEKKAKAMADSLLQVQYLQSVEEMARKYEAFGNKPTYFINGINVPQEAVNRLTSSEIVERNIKIQDTSSGNPNGEVWFTVTDKAMRKLGLRDVDVLEVVDVQVVEEVYPAPVLSPVTEKSNKSGNAKSVNSINSNTKNASSPAAARVVKSEKKAKAPKRSVRQIKADRFSRDNKEEEDNTNKNPLYGPAEEFVPATQPTQPKQQPVSRSEEAKQLEVKQPVKSDVATESNAATAAPAKQERKTYVRARTVNNEEVKVSDPVDGVDKPLN